MKNSDLITLAQSGNLEAKNKLVENNTRLVWSVVGKIKYSGYDKEDLFQVGCIGLIKSIDKFDKSFNVKFSTYAFTYILGEIKKFIRDDGIIKVSRRIKEINYKIIREKDNFINQMGREPTIGELSSILEISKVELASIINAGMSTKVKSLGEEIYSKDGSSIKLLDKLKSKDDIEKVIENRVLLKEALEKLDDIEKKIIMLRYFRQKKQREISKMMGITQVKVCRIEKKALNKMKLCY